MNGLVYMGCQDNVTYAYAPHYHRQWEVTYYLEGEGVNITNGLEYPFSAGTIVVQPPYLYHEDKSEQGYKNFFFEVENFDLHATEPIVIKDTENKDFLQILKQMYQEYFPHNDAVVTESLLSVLSVYLLRGMDAGPSNFYVEKLKRNIIFNFCRPDYQILAVMNQYPVSESQLRRNFRRKTGVTPQAFLQETRLKHAAQLLLDVTIPIRQVSSLCGYSDAYYFSRAFRQKYGLCPKAWREQNTKEADG